MSLLLVYARGGGTDQPGLSRFGEKKGRRDRSRRPVARVRRIRYITLPPLLVHSPALAASDQPWPLQAFCPLHALDADLQALWPLQALVPPHLMPAADAVVAKVLAAKIEAAAMTKVRLSIEPSLEMRSHSWPRFWTFGAVTANVTAAVAKFLAKSPSLGMPLSQSVCNVSPFRSE